jgi:signal transduction histidine kinase
MSARQRTTVGPRTFVARSPHSSTTDGGQSRRARWSTEAVQAREQAREEERRRLARELHDELGQALLGLKMNLVSMQRQPGAPGDESGGARISAMRELVERAIDTVCAIVTDLRPPALDQLGLVAALEWQAESFARRSGLRCRFTGSADVRELDIGRATAVFRAFQEMLTNVERHANANRVTVAVRRRGDCLVLNVRDNGRGVTPRQALKPSSFGLLGMRERAILLGGDVTIKSAPRKGTSVTMVIPLANRRLAARGEARELQS